MQHDLNELIEKRLSAIIDNDYIFLDLPYYTNIGDILIWKGTEEFLKNIPYKCLYRAAIETYVKPKISTNINILLQGGGNFGDIWRRHTMFCLRILDEFPNNKIIILPQTVYYDNETIMKQDANKMAKHPNLTICARDSITYKLLTTHFSKNNIILLPDMAFCIPDSFLRKYIQKEQNRQLFLKRIDKELFNYDFSVYFQHNNIEEHEWPSMEENLFFNKILLYLKNIHILCNKIGIFRTLSTKLVDVYAIKVYMPFLFKAGIKFISKYNYIYTTRLHGAILSILLHKPITFFDNSYGKNSSFYYTWLKNNPKVKFVQKVEMIRTIT